MVSGIQHGIQWILGLGARFHGSLTIVGLVLFGLYAILRNLLERVQFSKLTPAGSASVLQKILDKMFLLALVTTVLSLVAYIVPKVVPKDWLEQPPQLQYGVAVFQMFDPNQDPLAKFLQTTELYPGFPYFSSESDHPSAWPPRVFSDRQKLWKEYESFYTDPDVRRRLAAAPGFNPNSMEIRRNGPPDRTGELKLTGYIASARGYLFERAGEDPAKVESILGSVYGKRFSQIEEDRTASRDDFPNRYAVVRVLNAGRQDISDLGIELEVAGHIYDCVIDADPDKVRKSSWDGRAQRVSFEKLPSGYSAQVRIWYQYESLSERVFPDAINFVQELTQGIRIMNIAAAQTRVSYSPTLLANLHGDARLYFGDARKKDSYDKELAVQAEAMGKQMAQHMDEYDKEHPTIKNVAVEKLGSLNVNDAQISSIWLSFKSPTGKQYTAVHVFSATDGPYVLLSSTSRDEQDLKLVADRIAKLYGGEPEAKVTDRSDDICISINKTRAFTQSAIAAAAAELAGSGYSSLGIDAVNYDVKPEDVKR